MHKQHLIILLIMTTFQTVHSTKEKRKVTAKANTTEHNVSKDITFKNFCTHKHTLFIMQKAAENPNTDYKISTSKLSHSEKCYLDTEMNKNFRYIIWSIRYVKKPSIHSQLQGLVEEQKITNFTMKNDHNGTISLKACTN